MTRRKPSFLGENEEADFTQRLFVLIGVDYRTARVF
jgi:hypothetical protein